VFSNFISNAIKYCPEKSEVIVGIKDKGRDWLVYVEDRGEGIPAKFKKAVFERFVRVMEVFFIFWSLRGMKSLVQ
jgi:two-component system sensor histidine kinase SenX3